MAPKGKSAKGNSAKSGGGGKAAAKRWRRTALRWLRRLAIALGVLIILPPALTVLYRAEFTHPWSTLILRDMATLQHWERDWVEFEAIAPVLVQSVMVSEDGQYCSHNGVDWTALNAVIDDALDGEATRGASTITMQTAKNLFLWPSRSFLRKGIEIPLALWIDLVLPKQRVMEIYLNIAEWGDGIYGVEAASWTYFGRPASELTARQAALLAVTLPNPYLRDPVNPGPRVNRLANVIQGRAAQSGGYIGCLY
ncbi:MAG: monofunctional biosynthetic peptidoglycan transglycosylase [Ahrensia sp.]|nr:monofunctional biosynthetic peptidoglycan transglycosylase [Ahrensia sp.]